MVAGRGSSSPRTSRGGVFAEIVILWLAIVATTVAFFRCSKIAGLLMVPYLAWVSFASVLNSAGSCRLKSCELDPEMAHRVNVLGTANIMRIAEKRGARVIHLSIDLVFAGVPGSGDEALLSKLEPTVAAFCQSVDLSGRLILGQYEPVEEILSGTADRWYRLTVAVQYVYHA